MTIKELELFLDGADVITFQGKCHDCSQHISVVASKQGTQGGAVYKINVPSSRQDGIFIKCQPCFEKNQTLTNWRPCEVWSRCVGYLRPVNQWNKGKQAEWEARTPYILSKAINTLSEK